MGRHMGAAQNNRAQIYIDSVGSGTPYYGMIDFKYVKICVYIYTYTYIYIYICIHTYTYTYTYTYTHMYYNSIEADDKIKFSDSTIKLISAHTSERGPSLWRSPSRRQAEIAPSSSPCPASIEFNRWIELN